MSTVLTMGTFDTLHPGHVHLFEVCARMAGPDGKVVATVNTDRFVSEYKGRPPAQSETDRRRMVTALRSVSDVYLLDQHDAKPMIEMVKPDFLVIGVDWAPPKDYHAQLQVTPDWLDERGIALLFLDRLGAHSSTNLKASIRDALHA